jgi:putative spermidine/putrescine transport system permease protein
MKPVPLPILFFIGAVYAFLLLPIAIVVVASFNAGEYLRFPPDGLSLRWYVSFFESSSFTNAFGRSIVVGLAAAAAASIVGTPAAIFYVRHLRGGRERFRMLMLAPMLLPEVLTAIALLFFFNQFLFGTQTMAPLVIGHVVITLPFVFLSVTSALYNMPAAVEEAAFTLGAGTWTAFRRITLPLVKSGIVTGAMLAFIISFDNVNISLLLKSIGTSTLPIQLFDYLRYDFDPTAAAVSTLSVALTLIVVALIDRLYGLRAVRF